MEGTTVALATANEYVATAEQQAAQVRAQTAYDEALALYSDVRDIKDNQLSSHTDGATAAIESARQSAQSSRENRQEAEFFEKYIELLLRSTQTTVIDIEHTTSEAYQIEASGQLSMATGELSKVMSSSGAIEGFI